MEDWRDQTKIRFKTAGPDVQHCRRLPVVHSVYIINRTSGAVNSAAADSAYFNAAFGNYLRKIRLHPGSQWSAGPSGRRQGSLTEQRFQSLKSLKVATISTSTFGGRHFYLRAAWSRFYTNLKCEMAQFIKWKCLTQPRQKSMRWLATSAADGEIPRLPWNRDARMCRCACVLYLFGPLPRPSSPSAGSEDSQGGRAGHTAAAPPGTPGTQTSSSTWIPTEKTQL